MTEKEKKIMQTCGALVPRLTEQEKDRFLSFTEGMAFLSSRSRSIMTRDSAPGSRNEKAARRGGGREVEGWWKR